MKEVKAEVKCQHSLARIFGCLSADVKVELVPE